MAVLENTPVQQYTATGASGVFAFAFPVLSADDLVVLVDGVAAASFAVSGVGNPAGGTVTISPIPASGKRVVLYRDSAISREIDYQNNGDLLAAVVNRDFDRIWLVLQEIVYAGKSSSAAVRAPAGEMLTELPVASQRANKLQAFDEDGDAAVTAFSQAQLAALLAASSVSGISAGHIAGVEAQTVSAGATTITLASNTYTPGTSSIMVFAAGALLTPGVDFLEASASTLTLTTAFSIDTEVVVVVGRLVTSGVDSDAVSFVPQGAGAVARDLNDRNRDFLLLTDFMTPQQKADVRDFSGLIDCTAAWAAAKVRVAAAGGGRILMPPGLYRLTDDVDLDSVGIEVVGMGRRATRILQTNLSAKVFNITGDYCAVRGVAIDYDGTPTSGATAIYSFGSFCTFEDFVILKAYRGVEIDQGVSNKVVNFDVRDYESIGVFAHDLNDLFLHNFVLDAGNSTRGAVGGIRLEGKAEAVVVSNGDVLSGVYALTMAASVYGLGTRPAYSRFSNVYFDSAANGALIERSVEIDFANCWFSNRPENGAVVSECDGIRFSGGGAINCAKHGMLVQASALRVAFRGFAARGNSTAGANTYSGIVFAAGATDFQVQGCQLGGALGFGTQKYGVEIQAGASDRYVVADNLVSGNGTGGVSDGGSGANKRVANNY